MECSICLCDGANFTVKGCKHPFHHDCFKQWYTSKSEPACPNCRNEVSIKTWDEEKKECLFKDAFETILEDFIESEFKEHKGFRRMIMMDIRDIQYTINVLREEEWVDQDILEYLEDGELLDATRKPVSLYKFCGGKSPRGSMKQKIVRRNTCKR
jgi:hypothetical protein